MDTIKPTWAITLSIWHTRDIVPAITITSGITVPGAVTHGAGAGVSGLASLLVSPVLAGVSVSEPVGAIPLITVPMGRMVTGDAHSDGDTAAGV